MALSYAIGCGLLGLLLGGLLSWLRAQSRLVESETARQLLLQSVGHLQETARETQQQVSEKEQQIHTLEGQCRQLHGGLSAAQEKLQHLQHWREESQKVADELRAQLDINRAQAVELGELTIRLEEMRASTDEKQRLLTESEQRLSHQFENLANRIFESSGRRVDEQNKQSLNALITPLRDQLDGFRRQVQEGFGQEARERHTLSHEIRNLQQLNAQMTQEAVNLTQALKGNNKTQGTWGEVVLSRVLEASGLRAGHEYETQVNLTSEHNSRFQPDVIIRLPDNKDVVIDAKMALVAYERYFNSDDDKERESALKEHIAAIRAHLRILAGKNYQQLNGLRSLDYVLMFIPVEPAFLLAIDRHPELISEAQKQNVMLVSPTTLFVALRTIHNLWRYEHQNRHAQQIADRASKLYDKIRLFVDEMAAIGQGLDKAQETYRQAMKKLATGRGNLIAQTESFRQMGIEIKRPINPQLVEQAVIDEPEEEAVEHQSAE